MSLEALRQYEEEGFWLFHGSPILTPTLEPRQAVNMVQDKSIADGPPAIFTTPILDYAIFRAIVHPHHYPKVDFWAHVNMASNAREERIEFITNQETYRLLDQKNVGYVYVIGAEACQFRSFAEAVAYTPLVPVAVIEVTFNDLPIVEIRKAL